MSTSRPRARNAPMWVTALLVLLGVVCIVVGILYFAQPAHSLPSFFPGHTAHGTKPRTKHGIAAVVVGVLLLLGDPGIGKTSLLDHTVSRAREAGTLVLPIAATESESQLPFAGLHRLLLPVLPQIDGLPEAEASALRSALGLESHAAANDRLLTGVALLNLLVRLSADRPVLVLVDDADPSEVAWAQLPLHGVARVEARSDPGVQVDVEVAQARATTPSPASGPLRSRNTALPRVQPNVEQTASVTRGIAPSTDVASARTRATLCSASSRSSASFFSVTSRR